MADLLFTCCGIFFVESFVVESLLLSRCCRTCVVYVLWKMCYIIFCCGIVCCGKCCCLFVVEPFVVEPYVVESLVVEALLCFCC